MLTKVRLHNFRQHTDREFVFGTGLQTIRGAVESGKSTLLEAIVYGFFGAATLPLTLSETVTWGQPESTLRVDIEFLHVGQPYTLYRQKSGAELRGPGIVVSGPAEVTKYCEGLFGCSAAVAKNVLLADQGKLRGALGAGPGTALALIEKLGDIEMLDSIITKIQSQLPCGSTASLDALIEREQGIEPPARFDAEDHETEIEAQLVIQSSKTTAVALLRDRQKSLDIAKAHQTIGQNQAAYKQATAAGDSLTLTREDLVQAELELQGMADRSAELAKALEERAGSAERKRTQSVWQSFQSLPFPPGDAWVGDVDSLRAMLDSAESTRTSYDVEIRRLIAESSKAFGQIISEGECTLCGKDLGDVPEVLEKNQRLRAEMKAAESEMARLAALDKDLKEEARIGREILACQTRLEDFAKKEPELVRLVPGESIPQILQWVGPEVRPEPVRDLDLEISVLQKSIKFRLGAERKVRDLQSAVARFEEQVATSLAALEVLGPDVEKAKATLEQAELLKSELATAERAEAEQRQMVQRLSNALQTLEERYVQAQAAWNAAQERLKALRAERDRMLLHNQLIKKLREARPVVANRLWSLVLLTVSAYFSRIRGTPSVVARGDKDFLVDGHPAEGLSGSAKDSLGLAIRLALAKTFLPNLGFMAFDEPAAACNEERETNMLGVLSTLDFSQILMVTHSDLADAFSTNIIQL